MLRVYPIISILLRSVSMNRRFILPAVVMLTLVASTANAGLFGFLAKPANCEPANCEPANCEPACCEPVYCEPVCAPTCGPCRPFGGLFARLKARMACCEPACCEPACCEPACEPACAPACEPACEPVGCDPCCYDPCCGPWRPFGGFFARLKAKMASCCAPTCCVPYCCEPACCEPACCAPACN